MPSNNTPSKEEMQKFLVKDNLKSCYSEWNAKEAKCKFCGSTIQTCRNTSNARRHLVSCHGDEIASAMLHERQKKTTESSINMVSFLNSRIVVFSLVI